MSVARRSLARVAEGVVHPVAGTAFLSAEDADSRDFELHADEPVEVGACGEYVTAGRAWGAGGNALAIGLFLLNTLASLRLSRLRPQSPHTQRPKQT
jgi:hypothetical protein